MKPPLPGLYRELRQRYLGTEAYDFREAVLLDLGRQSLAASKPDDAVAWLQLNIEFHPKSTESHLALAHAHERKRDQAAAVKDLEKALALDPDNAAAKRQLARLRASIQQLRLRPLPQTGNTALKPIESVRDQLYTAWLHQ